LSGDDALIAKTQDVALGKIAAGSQIAIDRNTILSMLAAAGVRRSDFTISGAEIIIVKRQGTKITSQELLAVAEECLKSNSKNMPKCKWKPAWEPKELIVEGERSQIKLIGRMGPDSSQTQAKIYVTILLGNKEITCREMAFSLLYTARRAVAAVDIDCGSVLSSENIRI